MVVSPPPSLGVLILRDVPVNTEVGIDLKSWNVGPKFMGLKDIPLGIHFVYFSSVDKSMMSGLRVGFFHVFDKPGFAVYRWNPLEEGFFIRILFL
ncbi:unnamed protein product [Protopolystoma xenopodis]|uniref:Protein AAR2 homolog n=1 Tax=Protopolystoma xenopodis TaxID=117903 RepID=A0A3S5C5W3_9PLAT|nr:unnamed protein product [Protopolystoma xenopodis]